MKQIKLYFRRLAILWLFGKDINETFSKASVDTKVYLFDLLARDESRMIGSKLGLEGYYDADIEINRELQKQLLNNARD